MAAKENHHHSRWPSSRQCCSLSDPISLRISRDAWQEHYFSPLTSNSCFILSAHGKFDNLEYAGIWLITIVMTVYGMSAALIAGIIAALSTYAAQSVTHINPIRDMCTASSFRSSSWDRSPQALAILDDDRIGRNKILLIQLQGHVS